MLVVGGCDYGMDATHHNSSDLRSALSSLSICLMDLYVCLCILCDTELYLLVIKITMSS